MDRKFRIRVWDTQTSVPVTGYVASVLDVSKKLKSLLKLAEQYGYKNQSYRIDMLVDGHYEFVEAKEF